MKKFKDWWIHYIKILTSSWEIEQLTTRDKIWETWFAFTCLLIGGLSVRIPRLIRHHDECEVEVFFDNDRISSEKLRKAEEALAEIGIGFHTSFGNMEPLGMYTCWKWDNSMRGPILVRFKKRGRRSRNDGF